MEEEAAEEEEEEGGEEKRGKVVCIHRRYLARGMLRKATTLSLRGTRLLGLDYPGHVHFVSELVIDSNELRRESRAAPDSYDGLSGVSFICEATSIPDGKSTEHASVGLCRSRRKSLVSRVNSTD